MSSSLPILMRLCEGPGPGLQPGPPGAPARREGAAGSPGQQEETGSSASLLRPDG